MKSPIKIRNLPNESWAEAYEGYYISNMGRWYSTKSNRLLMQEPNSSGYLRAELHIDGKRKHIFTHIKVVELFGDCYGHRIPPNNGTLIELGLSIDHRNRDKFNNRQANLELVPHTENCLRKFRKYKIGGLYNGYHRH